MIGRVKSWTSLAVLVSWLASSACVTHYRIELSDARRARRLLKEHDLDEVTVRAVRAEDVQPVFIALKPGDRLRRDMDSLKSFRFFELGVNDTEVDVGGEGGGVPAQPQLILERSHTVPVSLVASGAGMCAITMLVRTGILLASNKPGADKKMLIPVYGPARFVDRNKDDAIGLFVGEFGGFFKIYGMLLLTVVDGLSIATLLAGFGLIEAREVSGPATADSNPPVTWSLTPSVNGGVFTLQF